MKGQRIDSETVVVNRYKKIVYLVEEAGCLLEAVRCTLSQKYPDQGDLRHVEPIGWSERFGTLISSTLNLRFN